jgi:AcrR family transcriptional regulator
MKSTTPRRPYRQGARALAAEQTAGRIIDAFDRRLREDWYDEITLERVAREAGVTVPTILRRFGGKEGLLEAAWRRMGAELRAHRSVPVGDAQAAVRVIVAGYEQAGDLLMRALAQEERYPAFKAVNDLGREAHRAWVELTFAPWLDGLAPAGRRARVDAIVAALDLYVWRLVRRDLGRSARQVQAVMLRLLGGALGATAPAQGESRDE